MDVAAPARAPTGDHLPGARPVEVGDERPIGVKGDGAGGHLQRDARPAATGLAATRPMAPGLGLPAGALLVEREVGDIVRRLQDYRAAPSPVAAVRSATRDEGFAAKRRRASTTVTAAHHDARRVDETRSTVSPRDSFRLRAQRVPGDGHAPAILADTLVLHVSADERKQRVVPSHSDAGAGTDLRAALADEDRAGVDQLATVDLHTKHLRVRVAPVARRAAAFLMCQLL